MRGWAIALGAATLAASFAVAETPIVEPPYTALADDAARYAARYGVDEAQAQARLRAQADAGAFADRIRAAHPGRIAGIAVEHLPRYRIVVLLTGDEPVPDETATLAGLAVPVIYRTGGFATVERMRDAIVRHQAAIRALLRDPPGLGIDQRTGALIVTASMRDADEAAPGTLEGRIAELTGLPVEIAVPGAAADLMLAGGERIEAIDSTQHRRYACTSGFVATDGTRTAVSTAAHCPDDPVLIDPAGGSTALPMIGAWGAGAQDVQLHAAPYPLPPAFRVGHGEVYRPVTGTRGRRETLAGDFVCHQGLASGVSCAEVIAPDFAPPGDLCAGPCPPEWVAVSGPDCAHGDSGGPVFDGTVALGLVKGGSYRGDGSCAIYYYMSIDHLPDDWRVLVAPPVVDGASP